LIAGRTLAGWLARADELGAAGRYFDAHEELERAWTQAEGAAKILLQGLIQICAGLHRLTLSPEKTDGAFYLLDRGLEKLRRGAALLTPESLAALETAVDGAKTAGQAPAALRFGLRRREPPPPGR
jgi:hypothetical protein